MRIVVLCCLLLFAVSMAAPLHHKNPRVAPTTYSKVKPIFQQYCVSCHSGAAPKHGLNLTTYANIMRGDQEGKVVIPGKPVKSRLCQAVKRKGPAKAMPPTQAIPAKAANTINDWVDAGCPND